MKGYAAAMKQHLGEYARKELGVSEFGRYKGREYAHILPHRLRYLNLVEPARESIRTYLSENPGIKEHQFFHHLNSSQAFALNLFYPYYAAGVPAARVLSKSLGVDADVRLWEFEAVPDTIEGTNVDVLWSTTNGERIFCEVKLTESEFGRAKADACHMEKLSQIYAPRLGSLVSEDFLAPEFFFNHYQILRNISLLAERDCDRLVFLMPRENEALVAPLGRVLSGTTVDTRHRIHVAYIEDCLHDLEASTMITESLRTFSTKLKAKYLPDSVVTATA